MRTAGAVGMMLGALLAAAAARPAAAGAQGRDYGLQPDSAGLSADTVRLPARRVPELEECGPPVGYRVVASDSAAAALRRFPQCQDAEFGPPERRTLVFLPLFGDCHAGYRVEAFRSESRREYRVRVSEYDGGCRAARFHDVWLELPPLPPGWRVAFTEEHHRRRFDGDDRDVGHLPFGVRRPYGVQVLR